MKSSTIRIFSILVVAYTVVPLCVNAGHMLSSTSATTRKLKGGLSLSTMISNVWEPSPDGRLFALPVQEKFGGIISLMIVDPGSKSKRQLADLQKSNWPAWSPDSRSVAFSKTCGTSLTLNIKNARLGTYSLATGKVSLLPGGFVDRSPNWDPSGKRIAFARLGFFNKRMTGKIVVIGANKRTVGEYEKSTNKFTGVDTPTWSPDGRSIAFMGCHFDPMQVPSGTWDLYLLNTKSGKMTKLTNTGDAMRYSLAWSPDSRYLAFALGMPSFSTLEVVDITNSKRQVILQAEGLGKMDQNSISNIRWSPDGKLIVFDSSQGSPTFGATYIGIIEWPGAKFRWLTNDGRSRSPRWLPDSTRILYVQDDTSIWRIRTDGTQATELYNMSHKG